LSAIEALVREVTSSESG